MRYQIGFWKLFGATNMKSKEISMKVKEAIIKLKKNNINHI